MKDPQAGVSSGERIVSIEGLLLSLVSGDFSPKKPEKNANLSSNIDVENEQQY